MLGVTTTLQLPVGNPSAASRIRLPAFLCFLLGLIFVLSSVAPDRASAYLQSNWYESLPKAQQEAVVDFEYQHGPQGVTAYAGAPAEVATHMTEALADEPKSALFYDELVSGATTTVESTGLIPKITSAIPYIGAAATAFAAGWEIGEGINALFLEVGLDEGSASGGSAEGEGDFCYAESCGGSLQYAKYGETFLWEDSVQQPTGAYLFDGTLEKSYWHPVYWFEEPCTFSGFSSPDGGHLETGVPSGTQCFAGEGLHDLYVDYPYVLPSEVLGQDTLHPYDPEVDGEPDYHSEGPEDPGTSTVAERTEESLDSEGSQLQQAWISWGLEIESQPEEDPAKIGVPPKGEESNDKCTPKTTPARSDPGASPEGYDGSSPESYVVSTFSGIKNPYTAEAENVKLYWGDEGFGYRHIQMGHGWSTADKESTGVALSSPDAITPDPKSSTTKRYYLFYTANDEKTECTRRVVVQWSAEADKKWPTLEEPLAKHIITSWAYPTSKSDPEPGTGL